MYPQPPDFPVSLVTQVGLLCLWWRGRSFVFPFLTPMVLDPRTSSSEYLNHEHGDSSTMTDRRRPGNGI